MSALSPARGPLATAVLALAFIAVALTTRLPFRDSTMFISDSVRYALALEDYDMTAGRPHPPGNPLYIGSAAAVDRLVDEPATSLAALSAVMSGIAFLFVYLLGRDLAGETAGWLAAGILIVSPLFWFFGAVAMPATGEAGVAHHLALTRNRDQVFLLDLCAALAASVTGRDIRVIASRTF